MQQLRNTHLFIDFDSTFNQIEALDRLIEITIKDEQQKEKILAEIVEITNLGMAGKLDYMQSLSRRIDLLNATKADVEQLAADLYETITPSILKHQDWLVDNKESVYIISNGFKDFIVPVIEKFGLRPDAVYANEFEFDNDGNVIGVEQSNPLAKEAGKPKVIEALKLDGRVVMLGDGYNDYQVKKHNQCDDFIVLTENVSRESVIPLADFVAANFTEVINYLCHD